MQQMNDYNDFAQPWADRPNRHFLQKRANKPWFFAHYAFNWEVVVFEEPAKGKSKAKRTALLLPDLTKIPHMPGVNGVRDGGDLTMLNGLLSREGWQVLHPRDFNYLNVHNAIGGKYYQVRFMEIRKLANRVIERFNREDFNNWRRNLIANKQVPLPHPHILQIKEIELQDKINNLRDLHLPHVAKKQESLQLQLADLKQAISLADSVLNYEQ